MSSITKIYTNVSVVILNIILLIVLAEVGIGIAVKCKHFLEGTDEFKIVSEVALPPFKGFPNSSEFSIGTEMITTFVPYRYWERTEVSSKYFNIDRDGLRKTIKSPNQGADKIFVFGGSTTAGGGLPDELTMPSLLQKNLGSDFDVYNFGQPSYVSTQQVLYLLELIANENIPDVVIFYGGLTDANTGTYSPAIPRDPQAHVRNNDRKLRQEKKVGFLGSFKAFYQDSNIEYLVKWLKFKMDIDQVNWDISLANKYDDQGFRDLAVKTVHYYEQNIETVKALAEHFGFDAYFFWEPGLLSQTRNMWPYEKEIVERASPLLLKTNKYVYETAKKRLSGREDEKIFFLGDMFNDVDIAVFVGACHFGPKASALIAQRIFESINN